MVQEDKAWALSQVLFHTPNLGNVGHATHLEHVQRHEQVKGKRRVDGGKKYAAALKREGEVVWTVRLSPLTGMTYTQSF